MTTHIRTDWKPKWVSLPAKLYRAAAKVANGLSFNAYALQVICRDLGVAFETLDYDTIPRPVWKKAEGKNKSMLLLVPPGLMKAVEGRMKAMDFPVAFSVYVRSLIERDVAAAKAAT